MSQGKILAIDDEKNIRHLINNEFSLEGFDVTTAGNGEEGLRYFSSRKFDVVLLDIRLPKMNGIETLRKMRQKSPDVSVIMITGYGDISSAVESMKLGARDYVTKPFRLDELLGIVRQIMQEKKELSAGDRKLETKNREKFILCPSPSMQKLYAQAERIAGRDNTVLIQGETGVGKDVLAHLIHLSSSRRQGPFIIMDCGLLSQNLAESELYGHRKGAFSGASEDKAGLVEKSDKGTLFLDEIGNTDLNLQKKLLRFLETRHFRRIGETREIHVDSRIILATNLDLQGAVEKGILRKDLFYRMDISFTISPLRDRPEDIPPLAQHFLAAFGDKDRPPEICSDAMKILTEYSWPGNIRELRSVISKACIMAENNIIKPDDLPTHLTVNRLAAFPRGSSKSLEDVEKEHIMAVLEETGGNQTKAAEILGINRKTLYKKIHKHRIFS